MSDKIRAPWSHAVVANLNAFQRRGEFHPFTCGIDSDHGSLLALPNGWICPDDGCDYTQSWAHSFMATVYPNRDGQRGETAVTADGTKWQWIKFSWERRGRWVEASSPVRTASEP